MSKTYTPRHIAITGASRGLGRALAIEYAAQGISLYLSARSEALLDEVAKTCRDKGACVDTQALDVTDEAACRAWVDDICARGDGLDLMIANAGISSATSAAADDDGTVKHHKVKAVFDVNVQGVFNTIHPCIPHMKRAGCGHLAIMASVAGFRGFPGAAGYCASKAAVKVYGEGLRGELAKDHIAVSVICPGFVKTDMTDANDFSMPFLMTAEKAARIMRCGLDKGRGRIIYPLPMAFFAWLLRVLPDGLVYRLTKNSPSKSDTLA